MSKGKEQTKTKKTHEKASSRKKKKKAKPPREIDMVKFKKKIAEEMANAIPSKVDVNPLDEYDIKYREFISEDFTPNCIVFINRLISDSKTLPIFLKNKNNFHKIILEVVKELMMGEYEITLLSLFLDHYGWSNESFSVEENMLSVALAVKKALDSSDLFVKYYKRVNKEVIECFERWLEIKKDKKDYTYNEVNSRFLKLKKPFNTYCKTNYIDYNSVVDKILRMSLPYNENKQKDQESIPTINDSQHNSDHHIIINNIPPQALPKEFAFNPTEYIQKTNSQMHINNVSNINFENYSCLNQNKANPNTNIVINLREELKNKNSQSNLIKLDAQYANSNANNLKVTATASNPYLPGMYYNTAYKIEDNFINPEFNPMNAFWSQQSISDNNLLLGKLSAQNMDQLQQNAMEDDNLNHLLSKSNNNFFQSGISLKDYYNPELDPFNIKGSSMLSNKFEQLTNDKIKNTEGLLNANQIQGSTALNSMMNQNQALNYGPKADCYFQQAMMSTLLNMNPIMSNQPNMHLMNHLSNIPDLSESKLKSDSRKDLLGKFQQLQDQETKNK